MLDRHPDDHGDWLVVVISKVGFTKSPWDSYTKTFVSVEDNPSATQQCLDWWYALPESSYTRKVANVQLHWCSNNEPEDNTKELKNALYPPANVKELLER